MVVMEGRKARGRQRLNYMDGIKEVMGCERIEEVVRLAEERTSWQSIVANINIVTVR